MKVTWNLTLEFTSEYDKEDITSTMRARHYETIDEFVKDRKQQLQFNEFMLDALSEGFGSLVEVKNVHAVRIIK